MAPATTGTKGLIMPKNFEPMMPSMPHFWVKSRANAYHVGLALNGQTLATSFLKNRPAA